MKYRLSKILALSIIVFCGFLQGLSSGWAEETYPFVGAVTAVNVNIRAGQSPNFEKLGRLRQGEKVVVVDRDYSWYEIKLPVTGASYVSADFVTDIGSGIGRVNGDRVNVRASASTQSTVLAQVNKGRLIRYFENKDGWLKIEPVDDCHGWLLKEFVVFHSQAIPPPRKVELPSRSIYQKKKEAKAAAPTPVPKPAPQIPKTVVAGVVKSLGEKTISKDIRHKLVVDENTSYFLKGYRRVIDGFLNNKVTVEGADVPEVKAPAPVILVTKIELVL